MVSMAVLIRTFSSGILAGRGGTFRSISATIYSCLKCIVYDKLLQTRQSFRITLCYSQNKIRCLSWKKNLAFKTQTEFLLAVGKKLLSANGNENSLRTHIVHLCSVGGRNFSSLTTPKILKMYENISYFSFSRRWWWIFFYEWFIYLQPTHVFLSNIVSYFSSSVRHCTFAPLISSRSLFFLSKFPFLLIHKYWIFLPIIFVFSLIIYFIIFARRGPR